MHPVELIVPLFLGIFGLAIVIALVFVLIAPVLERMRHNRDTGRLRRALEQLEVADELIEEKRYTDAVQLLRQSVILDSPTSRELISSLREHHQNILSRSLVIAEEIGGRLTNIANVERLFIERTELLSLLMKASERLDRLVKKRESEGKATPNWTKNDFQKHSSEIRKELSRNQHQLRTELDRLFQEILVPHSEEITYH